MYIMLFILPIILFDYSQPIIPAPINLFVVVLIALPEVALFPASMSLASLVFFNLARCRSDMGPPGLKTLAIWDVSIALAAHRKNSLVSITKKLS